MTDGEASDGSIIGERWFVFFLYVSCLSFCPCNIASTITYGAANDDVCVGVCLFLCMCMCVCVCVPEWVRAWEQSTYHSIQFSSIKFEDVDR